jgi:tRNA dimethylallyltransferase
VDAANDGGTPSDPLPRAVAIVGPTAAGKSDLAFQVAERFGLPILACDSVQVYRELDIGSAKPSPEIRARVEHYGLDLVDPDQEFSAGEYGWHAFGVLREAPAIVCGGTGLYLRAASFDFGGAGRDESDDARRAEFERRWWERERADPGAPHRALAALDPVTARSVHPRNVVRTIRSLWLCEWHGEPISAVRERAPPQRRLEVLHVVLSPDPHENAVAIERRCHRMMERGWLREVEMLFAAGYGTGLKSMQSLGYKQLGEHLRGERSLDDATAEIVTLTRQYAKRQRTWFRHQLPAASTAWVTRSEDAPLDAIERFLAGGVDAREALS